MNRIIPFGYEIKNGETAAHETESAAVKRIFELYLAGFSFAKIAAAMEADGVRYAPDSTNWNKNMAARILENRRYCGLDGFPKIIEPADFEQTGAVRAGRFAPVKTEKRPQPPLSIPVEAEVFIYAPGLEATRLGNELRRALEQTAAGKEDIRGLLFKCAEASYACVNSKGAET
jgi:hypothetical protein